jgi:hypothetical protein
VKKRKETKKEIENQEIEFGARRSEQSEYKEKSRYKKFINPMIK